MPEKIRFNENKVKINDEWSFYGIYRQCIDTAIN